MTPEQLRQRCADALSSAPARTTNLRAFVGLDGFVDEIIHVVDKRESAASFQRLPTIAQLAERLAAAAGKSTNVELVTQRTKLGGNGPIMADALAALGLRVTYVGALGHPHLHPVFEPLAARAEVWSIGEPGHTDALEFEDGKIMLGKHAGLGDITWPTILARVGAERFAERFLGADLVGFVNWTMLPHMSDVWEALLAEVCPRATGARRTIFFDLADPEKRTAPDLRRALSLIARFEHHFEVILGLNEKEAYEVGAALGLDTTRRTPEGLGLLGREIQSQVAVTSVVVHPTAYALAVRRGQVSLVEGPYTEKPVITTGAGDHFNAGFCTGRLLGLDDAQALLCGVAASGHYVRTGASPSVADVAALLRAWPSR
jgi:sugar/nucleoside kinase (ribokinase family)